MAAPALAAAQGAPAANPLVSPARAVSAYLEAVAAAAPPRPRGMRPPPAPTGGEPRWARARDFLAPGPAPKLAGSAGAGRALAPWEELGRDGAFLGYELTGVRRAARGMAVVSARERTTAAPDGPVVSRRCAYLVVPVGARWLIADRRCGGDFPEAEPGAWADPGHPTATAHASDAVPPATDSLPEDKE
jgi:hypothetical protein